MGLRPAVTRSENDRTGRAAVLVRTCDPSAQPVRLEAFQVLVRVERGEHADRILRAQARAGSLSAADARQLRFLTYGVIRRRLVLDRWIRCHSHKEPPARVRHLLHLGLYEISDGRSPGYAVVNTYVELAKRLGLAGASGYINALLRLAAREGKPAFTEEETYPDWLADAWKRAYGEATASAICAAQNQSSRPCLRVNTRRISPDDFRERMRSEGVDLEPAALDPDCFYPLLGRGSPLEEGGIIIENLPGYEAGHFWVQNETPAFIGRLAARLRASAILDFCAAPGGKSFVLATTTPARLVAYDVDEKRLARMAQEVSRLGLEVDLTPPVPGETFDLVLVDAPCSNTGVIQKHPEVRLRISPHRIERHARRQAAILSDARGHVGPGGFLLYATCSLQPEENEEVVNRFLDANDAFIPVPVSAYAPEALEAGVATGPGATVLPDGRRHGGFFALLKRR